MTTVRFASCRGLHAGERDDEILAAALRARGVAVEVCAWDDPGVDWGMCDGVVLRTTWDYTERLDDFLAWVDGLPCPVWNAPALVRWNAHKGYLRELERAGVPIVPTAWLEQGTAPDLGALIRARGWKRCMLKPAVGLSAIGTHPFDVTESGLSEALAHAESWLSRGDLMLQPFRSRVHAEGEVSIIVIDGEPTHAVRKTPTAGDYRVQDDYGAADERIDVDGELAEITLAALAVAGGDPLYARADFLADDDGAPNLVELELIEPSLFFRHATEAAERMAEALLARHGTRGMGHGAG